MGNKRLTYFDSMRGFAMLLVVTGHVLLFSFDCISSTFISSFFCGVLQLPLFFMVSGYFSIKSDNKDNVTKLFRGLGRRFNILIVSALIFMTFFCIIHHRSIIEALFGTSKVGYWYTIALFEFYLIYISIEWLLSIFKIGYNLQKIFWVIILFASIIIYPFFDKVTYEHCNVAYGLLGLYHFQYFIYFLFGIILRQNIESISKALSKPLYLTILVALFPTFIISLDYRILNNNALNYLLNIIFVFDSLILVYLLFKNWNLLTENSYIGKTLQTIGRHTLSIYYLHYFFIFMNLSFIGIFLKNHSMPLLEFVLAMFISLIVIAACLIVDRVLRLSPLIAKYLLGEKPETNIQ